MAGRTSSPAAVTMSSDQELVITRVFDAPRDLVFKAGTEPQRLMRWWGPNGFTTPFCKVDLRPGGVFHYCMRSPEGQDYWGRGVYREIVEPERIVYLDSFADEEGTPVEPAHYGMSPGHPAETAGDGDVHRAWRHDKGYPASCRPRGGSWALWVLRGLDPNS